MLLPRNGQTLVGPDTVGADGVNGCGFTVTLADAGAEQPKLLVTVIVCGPGATPEKEILGHVMVVPPSRV